MASKGDETRQGILAKAFDLATVSGMSALTIGRLAEHTGLSKSGLFAHFGSKEALEVAVVEEASRQFVQDVLVPALREPRGEPRIRKLFERWLAWGNRPGGCFFVGASAELDERPGPARDALSRASTDWLDQIATSARIAQAEGHFRADLDPHQFAFEAYSIMLGANFFLRFLRDPKADQRTRRAFDDLLCGARAKRK
jgi:AcrR family transcriptional regulator